MRILPGRKIYRYPLLLVIIIIFAEAGLRIFFSTELNKKKSAVVFTPDTRWGYLPIPYAQGVETGEGGDHTFKLNNHGFIGPDFNLKKKDGAFRIIIVGDSNFEGYKVADTANCTYQLQQLLTRHAYPTEVINCSIGGGYRGYRQYEYVKNGLDDFHPDLILFQTSLELQTLYVSRDSYRNYCIEYTDSSKPYAQSVVDAIYSHQLLTGIYDASFIVRAASRYYLNNFFHHSTCTFFEECLYTYVNDKVRLSATHAQWKTFSKDQGISLLTSLHDTLHQKGAEIIFFKPYDPKDDFYATLSKAGLPVITASPEEYDPGAIIIKDDLHYNSFGHRLIAQSMYKNLVAGGFLPHPTTSQ